MYKDMTMKEFNKGIDRVSKDARAQVSMYIAKATHAFMQGGKKTIKIPYFFK
jgi:autotransporter adhesin